MGARSGGVDCGADRGTLSDHRGIYLVDGCAVSVGGIVFCDGPSAAVGDKGALFQDSQSDLCVRIDGDDGWDSGVREAGVAADLPAGDSVADLASRERIGGAAVGVRGGIPEVSSGDLVLKGLLNGGSTANPGLKPRVI